MMDLAKHSRLVRTGAIALTAFVFIFPACSTGDSSAPVAAAEPSTTMTPAAPAPQDAGFKVVQDERALATQKNDTLVKAYLANARAAMQAQDYKRAEESVLQALQLRPQDPDGTELFKQVMGLQGIGLGSLEDTVAMVQNRRQLARQQQVLLVKDAYTKATHAEAQGELESARIELEQAQLMVRYDAYETDFGVLKADVDGLLADVRAKLDAKKKASETDDLRAAYDKLREQEAAQRAREDETVRNLLVASVESFQRGQFDNCESQANRVLKLQPGNTKAKELIEMARQSRHLQWNDTNYRRRREETDRWLVEIRAAQIPVTDVLTWASHDEWERISRRTKRGDFVDRALEANDSDAIRAIRAKLDNDTVTWDFGEAPQPFKEVVKLLRTANGINVVVDPEVANEKNEEQVTVTLRDYKLGGALKILLEGMKLDYALRDDVLYITTAEKAMGKAIPRVYEVRDLTLSLPHFKAPILTLRPGPAGETALKAGAGEELERTTDTDLSRLVDLIRENVGVGTWEVEGHSIQPSSGQIVISTTPRIHAQVTKFLDDLRKFNKLTVHVEARFLNVDRGFLSDFGIDFRGLGGQNPGQIANLDDVTNRPAAINTNGTGFPASPASAGLDNGGPGMPAGASQSPSSGLFYNDGTNGDYRGRTENIFDSSLSRIIGAEGGATVGFSILDDDLKIGMLLRAVERSQNITIVNAPRLTIYNRQRANLSIINQIAYVKDYDTEVAQTAFIADPLIDIVQDGLTLDVRPTVSYDRKYVTIDLQPTVATVTRPMRTFTTALGGLSQPVEIEMPEVKVQSAASTVTVPDNGWVVIGGLRRVSTIDQRSETPILSQIPLLGMLFSRKGRADEIQDLTIILHVKIVDLSEEEKSLGN